MTEHFGTRPKKVLPDEQVLKTMDAIWGGGGRGRSRKSLDLIDAMAEIAKATQPITGRGIGYKLFTAGLIPSMSRTDMKRVYRLLKLAREDGTIPWHWIVDEARSLERTPSWDDPEEFAKAAARQYRRDFCTGSARQPLSTILQMTVTTAR